ncbi:MAG TPA: helix-turn-helix domain-containing protein [Solirubrobacteraceae bacterium]|nr:helix-turn-helix domain-containing protein [Solirubrobacteraceae bacterium]
MFEGFVGDEAEGLGLTGQQFASCWPHERQVGLMDRLVLEVTEAYETELVHTAHLADQERIVSLRRLLAGERVDLTQLGCAIDGWHLAVIAIGTASQKTLRLVQARSGVSALIVRAEPEVVWAWFSSRRQFRPDDLDKVLSGTVPPGTSLAVGEPGRGINGWRLTHRQAQAALRVVLSQPRPITRYTDVMLLATALEDEILASSLVRIYLAPLGESNSTRGASARSVLRAYFRANEHTVSAAEELNVSTKTVVRRLRSIEQLIGHPLSACSTELRVALCLEKLQPRDEATDRAR